MPNRFVIIYNKKNMQISNATLNLGITKKRYRDSACFTAVNHKYILSDINQDGSIDIGVIKEELICKNLAKEPFYKIHKIKWYLFKRSLWVYQSVFDNKESPTDVYKLPYLCLLKSPIDYILQNK